MNLQTPNIDISPDQWDIVRNILQEHVPGLEVWAFGSRAKWTAKQYSDLDLAIITKEEPLPLETSAALREAFSESDLPWKVDVVDWAATGEDFRKVIERDHVDIHARDQYAPYSPSKVAHAKQHQMTLGDICQVQGGYIQTGPFGSQLHASDYTNKGIPVVMPANISNGRVSEDGIARISASDASRLAKHQLTPGDIVFSRRGDVTRFALTSDRENGWICGTGCLKVNTGTGPLALPGFVAAALSSSESKDWLVRHAVGATMPNINTEILSRIPIALPPLTEQRTIVHALGTLDDKIELNRRMNETLEAMARALFKAWFVDFEPVRAKMEGCWKRGQSLLGLPAHLYDLFSSGYLGDDTYLKTMDHRTTTLEDFAILNPESWTRTTRPHKIHYVDLSNTKNGFIEKIITYNAENAPSRAQRVLRPNDTIFGTVRPANKSFAFVFDEELTGSTGLAVLRPKKPEYREFVYLTSTSQNNIQRLSALADGAAYPAVRPEALIETECHLPEAAVLKSFSRLTAPLFDQMAQRQRASLYLCALRDTLLPKLLSGEVRISNPEHFLQEAGLS